VEAVLDILRREIESTLAELGHTSIEQLTPDDILVPDGFTRRPGTDRPPPARRDQA
jgi:isopentenyl diphosphate isomerase/L-lactate dehydrogenase-like FMN-dependent dehydrogenase